MVDRTKSAAEIIANEARRLAAWSVQVPLSIKVSGGGDAAEISSRVGPAYPNEVPGVFHPVFGNRRNWVLNQYRPFLAPAADAKADAVAQEIGRGIDDLCLELGYRDE